MLTREFADKLLAAAGQPDAGEAREADRRRPEAALSAARGLDAHRAIDDRAQRGRRPRTSSASSKAPGPHADETVVIGGHYDHLGHGGLISGSLAFLSRDIHNGADDNASGTAMVLELARRLANRPDPPPRRVVFMAFSGEEQGLLGSQHYVEHPLFPLSTTVMMFNCDMVGRLNEKERADHDRHRHARRASTSWSTCWASRPG